MKAVRNRRGAALLEATVALALLVGGISAVLAASRTLILGAERVRSQRAAHWLVESLRSDARSEQLETGQYRGEHRDMEWTIEVLPTNPLDIEDSRLLEAHVRVEWTVGDRRHALEGVELYGARAR